MMLMMLTDVGVGVREGKTLKLGPRGAHPVTGPKGAHPVTGAQRGSPSDWGPKGLTQ